MGFVLFFLLNRPAPMYTHVGVARMSLRVFGPLRAPRSRRQHAGRGRGECAGGDPVLSTFVDLRQPQGLRARSEYWGLVLLLCSQVGVGVSCCELEALRARIECVVLGVVRLKVSVGECCGLEVRWVLVRVACSKWVLVSRARSEF